MTDITRRVHSAEDLPRLIQGGMGVGVSDWRLARAVGKTGQLGIVSGTALDVVLSRRLQLGDPDGDMRRAIAQFPWPAMAQRVLERWWRPEGLAPGEPYATTLMGVVPLTQPHVELLVVGGFCEVFLAREGHTAPIGMNLLEKVQLPSLAILLGAMLAHVDVIAMGGGIPLAIPGILDGLVCGEVVEQRLEVVGSEASPVMQQLDPAALSEGPYPELARPLFLGIVSSDGVAKALLRRGSGTTDGFVVEHHRAGGHNAPPRRASRGDDEGPAYGPKDEPDLDALRALGVPYWVGGGISSPEAVQAALAQGANGVQVGTPFAACRESGFVPELKASLRAHALAGDLVATTDFRASPTGYPFKLTNLPEAPGGWDAIDARERICDMGFLRTLYLRDDGRLGFRCPAESPDAFMRKGGGAEEIEGRRCLCNGLLAAIGLAQRRPDGIEEPAMVTLGTDWSAIAVLTARDGEYSAADVVAYLLGEEPRA